MTILIKCVDREIFLLGTYQNEAVAYLAMEVDLAKEMDMDCIPEDWDEVEYERYDEFDIKSDGAWLNKDGCGYDWKIITV